MDKKILEAIAIDWVCPHNHNPTTSQEKDEVKRLIRFAEDIILAIGYDKLYEALKNLLNAFDLKTGKFEYIHPNRLTEASEALAEVE